MVQESVEIEHSKEEKIEELSKEISKYKENIEELSNKINESSQ